MVNNWLKHILCVIWNWIRWTVAQYLGLLMIDLLKYAYWYIIDGGTLRELLQSHASHTLYSFGSGLMLFIPVATLLFCIWKEIRRSGRLHWSMIVPQLILMALVYLEIAYHLDWNVNIITVDDYMLGGWLASLYGAAVQLVMGRFKQGR